MLAVNPKILRWARETAGLSTEGAARKLGIRDARGIGAADRLLALEEGKAEIGRSMLVKMAKAYHRPLLAFYLEAPPPKGDRGEDFRNLPNRSTGSEALVDALVRDVKARQNIVRAILEEEEEATPLPWVGSASMEGGVGQLLASIRQMLAADLADYRAQPSPDAAFAFLRGKVEAAGVFVLLIGSLGSHHTAIPVDAFRGFAVADPIAPFIVINDQDAKAAWSFTLLHELAHLWLGATGVSGAFAETGIEQFCNDVAADFLLPAPEIGLVRVNNSTEYERAVKLIGDFATARHLSRSMVAYRLFRSGEISEPLWRRVSEVFRQAQRATKSETKSEREGGPNYYVVRRHRIGSALLRFAARHMSDGVLTPTEAGKVLGVKPRNVAPLLSTTSLGPMV
jgi:Zn-dependent peptidase ImmA (M78 family)/transcriptional regulator with XRE-family HTH domain